MFHILSLQLVNFFVVFPFVLRECYGLPCDETFLCQRSKVYGTLSNLIRTKKYVDSIIVGSF